MLLTISNTIILWWTNASVTGSHCGYVASTNSVAQRFIKIFNFLLEKCKNLVNFGALERQTKVSAT